ncbi:MAG: hypothetical protein E7164_00135 [Firmicutes bacterium]|nr:hypothetical protein [Bacillota bacterium]
MNNYDFLLKIKTSNSILYIVILIILLLVFVLMFVIYTYSSYHTMGIYNDGLIVSVPLKNSDVVIKGNYLMIENRNYEYEVLEISDIQAENYINYQDLRININEKFKENQVVEITFYYNKQRLIKKIVQFIF